MLFSDSEVGYDCIIVRAFAGVTLIMCVACVVPERVWACVKVSVIVRW